ncbi:hypothetical protein PV327_007215 [Microctonus hyperodae]|uniref:Soluble interferon alpha/beta receptor OPG204 n=1 Tax=Microctonus hyperodae TaxID=165561 RepID=A0AA39F5W9_MICHY|nr:hypothetical protein PV327_007215 [Microctonus hyperodae]
MAIRRRNNKMLSESRMLQTIFLFLTIFINTIFANLPPLPSRDDELEDYCSVYKFKTIPSGLRFTKEIVTMEYASVGAFKAIHCCLRGYRSIEWYKDDKAYPWPGAVSHFILYPESANQTIYTHSARASDAGQYSCRARNDTDILTGDISLEIVAGGETSGYTGKPLPTYKPISQSVSLGGAARLFCEAYLGKVDLPDATNSVTWAKAGSNFTVPVHGRISQHRVSREDEQVVGSYLEIVGTKPKDYGEYECIISNGADDEMILSAHIYRRDPPFDLGIRVGSWRKALLLVVLGIIIIATAIAFYIRCWLSIAIICRDKFLYTDGSDGKEFDALVCYHEKDGALTVGTLVPTLEMKYRYKCTTLEISHSKCNWHMEIEPHASTARRIIVILSQNSLSNEWNEANVSAALKSLSLINNRVIVIILNEFTNFTPFAKLTGRTGVTGVDSSSVCNKLKVLRWKINSDNDIGGSKFWCQLRLAMPPRSLSNSNDNQSVAMVIQTKNAIPKAHSHGSLEVLV